VTGDLEHTTHSPPERTPASRNAQTDRVDHRITPVTRAASGIGNRGFTALLSRMHDGEGILPSGLVHPDVQAAITSAQGGGGPLSRSVSRHLETSLGEPLGYVRVHVDDHAAALARAVSARAFTVGSDIFFGSGEYNPSTRGGTELIAHEVAHVVQQRGAAVAGPLSVSQPGDASEREAEAVARDVTGSRGGGA
jgi:hypothetical protein